MNEATLNRRVFSEMVIFWSSRNNTFCLRT